MMAWRRVVLVPLLVVGAGCGPVAQGPAPSGPVELGVVVTRHFSAGPPRTWRISLAVSLPWEVALMLRSATTVFHPLHPLLALLGRDDAPGTGGASITVSV